MHAMEIPLESPIDMVTLGMFIIGSSDSHNGTYIHC